MKQWYTLHTKPNAEYQVAATLKQRGIQTYLPELESPKARQGRRKKPFFPCYLFIRTDFEAVGLSQVQWTPGLRRIVAFDDRPTPLGDEIITLIRRKLDALNASGGQVSHPFKPGETVRITGGPLQNLLAIFDGPATATERVQVLLNILGHASRVQVDVADLEKTSSDAQAPMPKRPRRTRGRGRWVKPK
ncbi:MAG: transcription termination/antitermination protein NusG [Anaerolineae bacterium]